MELNTDKSVAAAEHIRQGVQRLSNFYKGMSWEDEVGASFEGFVTDMQRAAQEVESLAQQAQNLADDLEEIDVDELEDELNEACALEG